MRSACERCARPVRTIFASLFTRLESASYQGHYMMAFGDQADKLQARDFFVKCMSGS